MNEQICSCKFLRPGQIIEVDNLRDMICPLCGDVFQNTSEKGKITTSEYYYGKEWN